MEKNVSGANLNQALINALIGRNTELPIIKALLQDGADVNTKDLEGYSPLLLACHSPNYEDIAQLLIEWGADVKFTNTDWTALHYAVFHQWLGIIRSLVSAGADLNANSNIGFSPLLLAATSKKRDAIRLLIDLGADVMCCDIFKVTALHFASLNGWLDVVQSLLKRGADPNAGNIRGKTPLHIACEQNRREIISYLIKAGGDCQVKDHNGITPSRIFFRVDFSFESIKWFVSVGGCLKRSDYNRLLENYLKKIFLQDAKIGFQTVMYKFNEIDLPLLYACPISTMLPPINIMKIVNGGRVWQEIESNVESEIQRTGHCHIFKYCPLTLSTLCVQSFMEYYIIKND